jgi:hypothetical protein
MSPESRACTKCGLHKALSEFSKAPRGKYGRKSTCKACDAARSRENFKSNALSPEELQRRLDERRGETKKCTRCGITKPRTEFYKASGKREGQVKPRCKACDSELARKWFADNKERARENKHRWTLENTYGITSEEYQRLLAEQRGVCAICHQDEPNEHGRTGTKFRLAVDHCHDTGRVRGLLCQKCNRAIGLLNDDADLLRKAIGYLERGGSLEGDRPCVVSAEHRR